MACAAFPISIYIMSMWLRGGCSPIPAVFSNRLNISSSMCAWLTAAVSLQLMSNIRTFVDIGSVSNYFTYSAIYILRVIYSVLIYSTCIISLGVNVRSSRIRYN